MSLHYSMFHDVLLPERSQDTNPNFTRDFDLRRIKRFTVPKEYDLTRGNIVVFDFETTGLDAREDDIIEIGAIKLVGLEPVAEFSTLVSTKKILDDIITRITGLKNSDLTGQPPIEEALDKFLSFIEGSVLLAHNAEFDFSFLRDKCDQLSIDIEWPCFCSLKLARKTLPDLESKGLDALARHYDLNFEARHRSIGDVKVTCEVLKYLLTQDAIVEPRWGQISAVAVVH